MKDFTNDWASYVGKEFKGKRSGKYIIVKHEIYRSKSNEWDGKNALYIKVLSSEGGQKFPLLTDVLILMKERFKTSFSMDEAFNLFCKENGIPKLPSQHTVESYYVSFFENFLNDHQQKIESSEIKPMSAGSDVNSLSHSEVPTREEIEKILSGIAPKGKEIDEDVLKRAVENAFSLNGRTLKSNWWEITKENL